MSKMSIGLRSILVRRLTDELYKKLSRTDFIILHHFLSNWNKGYKFIPYGVFEGKIEQIVTKDETIELAKDKASHVFYNWLYESTSNIEKPHNRGRKLVRMIEFLTIHHRSVLAFDLWDEGILTDMLASLMIENVREDCPFMYKLVSIAEMNRILGVFREYLACVLLVDLVRGDDTIEAVLDTVINKDLDGSLFKSLVDIGVLYINLNISKE